MQNASLTRRGLLGGTAAGLTVLPGFVKAEEATPPQNAAPQVQTQDITLDINGKLVPLTVEPRTTLLDALREQARLTGTKKGCANGSCGACTVHLEDMRVLACLTLAVRCERQAITTIEGLSQNGKLHPMQTAFIKHDAVQCGYCTPGQIMSAIACMSEGNADNPGEIREWMSGNLCRCGAYPNIVAAIQDMAGGG